jgi:hypothetical protein
LVPERGGKGNRSVITAGAAGLVIPIVAGGAIDIDEGADDHALVEIDIRQGRISAVFDDGLRSW